MFGIIGKYFNRRRSNSLKLYNTMSRAKETFKPRQEGKVNIFTCGPSTYQRPHIGNYRSFLYEDILVRYLKYKGYKVKRVINFTDVEDKAIIEAQSKGKRVREITADVSVHFFKETKMLDIILPDEIPRSSTSVPHAVQIIKKLIKDGFAYWHKGDVFFDPLKAKDFGKLFRLDMSSWPKKKVHFKRDTYVGKRWNKGDFILWHGHDNESQSSEYWDTEIGKGRPAWNIQDPAMIIQQVGTQVDINCGGIDNIYRHHDYNIAVMESYSGKPYANFYMHGEHLIIDGKPMSKSLGNILYPDDLVEKGYEHKHLRFFLTQSHYRRKLNFTGKNFTRASEKLDTFRTLHQKLSKGASNQGQRSAGINDLIGAIVPAFEQNMDDDLGLGAAFDSVYAILKQIDIELGGEGLHTSSALKLEKELKKTDTVFAVLFP